MSVPERESSRQLNANVTLPHCYMYTRSWAIEGTVRFCTSEARRGRCRGSLYARERSFAAHFTIALSPLYRHATQ